MSLSPGLREWISRPLERAPKSAWDVVRVKCPRQVAHFASLSSVGRAPDCSRKKTQPSVKADIRGPPVQVWERGPIGKEVVATISGLIGHIQSPVPVDGDVTQVREGRSELLDSLGAQLLHL